MQRASVTLERLAGSDQPDVGERVTSVSAQPNGSALSFEALIEGWAQEKRPAAKTKYEWSRVAKQFASFLGHDDAAAVTAEGVFRWKAALIKVDLQPKTICDAKLAPVRAMFQWAVDNRRLKNNPAERITLDATKAGQSKRGFTDDEATLILTAAAKERDPVRRWVPILCAYSGARVAEICQLRKEDIIQIDGLWAMKFDPDAGPLKTRGSERAVPLHRAVIEAGFLDFVQTVAAGPLFVDLSPDMFGSRGGNGTKVIGRWVRSIGLRDQRLSPNHSWRHRFKTLGRRHGLELDIVNAITGHGRRTVADSYGEFPMSALHRELRRFLH